MISRIQANRNIEKNLYILNNRISVIELNVTVIHNWRPVFYFIFMKKSRTYTRSILNMFEHLLQYIKSIKLGVTKKWNKIIIYSLTEKKK